MHPDTMPPGKVALDNLRGQGAVCRDNPAVARLLPVHVSASAKELEEEAS
jgi:hypothetical protein